MFSLAIAGGIYLLDHKIKEYADSHFLRAVIKSPEGQADSPELSQ